MNLLKRNRNLLDYLNRKITKKYLKKISRKHIKARDQLVMFSYDFISQSISLDGRFEDNELTLVENKFKEKLKEKVTLDVGANIGNHTLALSKLCKKVYSFEPNPIVFEVLKLNSKNLSNVQIFNFGASNESQSVIAKIPKLNCGAGSVSDEVSTKKNNDNFYEFSFNLIPLDSLKDIANQDIGLVKIDVEGHELQAFKGMQLLLKKYRPIILFEQNRGIINGTSDEIEFLNNIGYKHLYELVKIDNWITPNFLPKIIVSILRFFEVIVLGEPSNHLKLKPISKLTKNNYDMLVYSFDEIDE